MKSQLVFIPSALSKTDRNEKNFRTFDSNVSFDPFRSAEQYKFDASRARIIHLLSICLQVRPLSTEISKQPWRDLFAVVAAVAAVARSVLQALDEVQLRVLLESEVQLKVLLKSEARRRKVLSGGRRAGALPRSEVPRRRALPRSEVPRRREDRLRRKLLLTLPTRT